MLGPLENAKGSSPHSFFIFSWKSLTTGTGGGGGEDIVRFVRLDYFREISGVTYLDEGSLSETILAFGTCEGCGCYH